MSERMVVAESSETDVVARWASRATRRYWRPVVWSVVWIAAIAYTTNGFIAPVLLFGLLVLTVSTTPVGGAEANRND